MNNVKQEIIPILKGLARELDNPDSGSLSVEEIDYDWYADWIIEKFEQYAQEQEEYKRKLEEFIRYYNNNPVKWVEYFSRAKLYWYQKVLLRMYLLKRNFTGR
jgi:hypothetical protein